MTITVKELTTLLQARYVLKKMCKDPIGPEERCLKDLKRIINRLYGVALERPLTFEWDTGDDEAVADFMNDSDLPRHEAPNPYTEYFKPVPPEQITTRCEHIRNGLRAGASIPNLKVALDKFQAIIADEDFDQTVVVEEECTELLKEICKLRRGKGDREHLMEETIDIVTACMTYNQVCGGSLEDLIEKAVHKVNRAIKEYEVTGKL